MHGILDNHKSILSPVHTTYLGIKLQTPAQSVLSIRMWTLQFCLRCVTPVVLTPNRCEIPRCHGCACDLLVRVRDLCAQATKSL